MAAVVAGTALEGVMIGGNGAVGMHGLTREVLFEDRLDADAQRVFTEAMMSRFPGAKVRSVRSAGNVHVIQHGYPRSEVAEQEFLAWPIEVHEAPVDEVLAMPSVKLVLQHERVDPVRLFEAARELAVPGCHPTFSGASFLEVGPAGVTKATGLERLCRRRGIEASDVVAFGDNINDVEMLAWAGLGVAMGNAAPEAKAAAHRVTASNDEDGIAQVIEQLLT